MNRLALILAMVSVPGPALARDSAAAVAVTHCQAALDNARRFEDAPLPSPRALALCESWYGEQASEAELGALVCMAKAGDRETWDACRAPFAPVSSTGSTQLGLRLPAPDRQISPDPGVLGALRDGEELDGVFGVGEELTGGIGGLIGARGTSIGHGGLGTHDAARGSLGGGPIILGALDKGVIDAEIKAHLEQIRACYQAALSASPSLAGKLVVKFVITKDGAVSSATTKSSTLGSPEVEGCVNEAFLGFHFPEPRGGGIVIVSYPFLFQPEE